MVSSLECFKKEAKSELEVKFSELEIGLDANSEGVLFIKKLDESDKFWGEEEEEEDERESGV